MHLPQPDWRPDAPATWWATRCSGDLMGDQMAPGWPDCCWSCCLLGKYQGLLNKCEQKQASFDDQIAPGDQIGRPDFHILVTSKIWSPIRSPGAIWSPIRSPEHLVVDLVVVDAFSLSNAGKSESPNCWPFIQCGETKLSQKLLSVSWWSCPEHHWGSFWL